MLNLKLSFLEFFVRVIPEVFLFVFAIYTFSKTTLNVKKYLISSGVFAIIAFIIRWLPIQYGVHTILNLFVLIMLATWIIKVDIIKSIQAGIIAFILEFVCEGVNVFIIQFILGGNLNNVFNNPTLKTLYGIPSLIIFACIVIAYYLRLRKRKELK